MEQPKLGIISGMGTRAGMYFVNKLIDQIDAPTDQDFPEFFMHNNSAIPDRTLAIVYGETSPINELERSLNMMKKVGADYIVSTCITSYHYLRQMDPELTINLLDPIKMIGEEIARNFPEVRRVGILATTGTMKSKLFHHEFEKLPYDLVQLNPIDQEEKFMKSVYMDGGFKSSIISNQAYELFNDAIEILKAQQVDLIIGGCTEVQIGMERVDQDFKYLDATDVLINYLVKALNLNVKSELIPVN